MFIALYDLLRKIDHLLRADPRVEAQVSQGAVKAVDVLLEAEGAAVEGARHVESAVAVFPAAVAEGDQHLVLRHEFSVKPGGAGISWLGHGRILLSYFSASGGVR